MASCTRCGRDVGCDCNLDHRGWCNICRFAFGRIVHFFKSLL